MSARLRPLVASAAPFWRRLLADLVDLTLMAAAAGALWTTGVIRPDRMPPQRFGWIDYAADLLANHVALFQPAFVVLPTIGILYAVLSRALLRGCTLGERLLGLRLVKRAGEPAGPLRAVAHALGTMAAVAPLLLGYLWAAVDPQRQGLAEYLSGSLLVVGEAAPAPASRDLTL